MESELDCMHLSEIPQLSREKPYIEHEQRCCGHNVIYAKNTD